MNAAKKLQSQTETTVRDFVKTLDSNEKKLLLNWSEKALSISRDTSLSKLEKIKCLTKIETFATTKVILHRLFDALKNKVWENQTWARRLGFIGLASGLSFGGAAVGIATMGAGMGVPLMLMTAAGGVILGAAIDEIKKELK